MKSVLPAILPHAISTISLTVGSLTIPIMVTVQNQSYSPVFWQEIASKLGELASTTINSQAVPQDYLPQDYMG